MPETHVQESGAVSERARFIKAFRDSLKKIAEKGRVQRKEHPKGRRRPMLLLLSTLFLAACASPELQSSPAFPLIFSANPPAFQVLANDGITLQEVANFIPVDPADPSATVHQRVSCMLAIPRDNPQLHLNDTIPEQLPLSRLAKNTMVKLPQECGDPASMERSMQVSAAPSTPSPPPEHTEQPPPEQDPRQELARASVMIEGVARGPFHLSTDLFGLRRAPIETTGFEDGYVILRQDDGVIAGPNDSGGLVAVVQNGHPVDVGVLSAADLEDVPFPRQWVVTRVTPQDHEQLVNQIIAALVP